MDGKISALPSSRVCPFCRLQLGNIKPLAAAARRTRSAVGSCGGCCGRLRLKILVLGE